MNLLPLRPSRRSPAALALITILIGVSACSGAPPRSRATAAAAAACRSRADEVYLKQNRDEVYRSDTYETGQRDSPFSTNGLPGITSNGLSGRYARDNLESNCINGTVGNVGESTDAQPIPTMRAVKTPGP